jgi:formylglycine-generating enzyme required for sulfatase activity
MDTSRFPVETVSWEDCGKFLDKVNDRGGAEKVFGKRGKFVLPHENEWEYACRGGRGNRTAFYFGEVLNGMQANCRGNEPWAIETKGPNENRTTEVGSFESKVPHPWALCDMHGNVWQWCENWYDSEQKNRILRGGAWNSSSGFCRAARRVEYGPVNRTDSCGFRVCFRLD